MGGDMRGQNAPGSVLHLGLPMLAMPKNGAARGDFARHAAGKLVTYRANQE